jgi:pSer/pThr/pTyr-binding forkhead associated (FHA) protein
MVTIPARARLLLFIAGLALIAFGGIGLLIHAPWGDVANSLFTIFGTTASFAQFSIGFSSLKPADGSAAKAPLSPHPNTTPPGYPNPGSPQAYLPYPPSPPDDRTATAILTGPSGQINLGSAQLTIGRAPDNQHVVNDSLFSGHHAIIRPEGQGYTITDLASTNGTYVNGQRLAARVPHSLSPGDTIRIGTTMFTYEVNKAPEIAKTVRAPEPLHPPPPQRYTPPKAYQPYAPPPPQSYTPQPGSTPIPALGTQKTYSGSGIALLLAGACTFIYLLLILSAPTPTESQALQQLEIFGLVGIFVLCGVHGFYAKQAHKVGWLGTIGTMMFAAAWILNILISCIFVVNASSNQPFSPEAVSSIVTLDHVNYFFLIFGDIILGISIIRAGVYPRWTGITLIVLGCLNLIYALYPQATAVEFMAVLLAAAIFSQWGLTLMKRSPNYPQQYRHL